MHTPSSSCCSIRNQNNLKCTASTFHEVSTRNYYITYDSSNYRTEQQKDQLIQILIKELNNIRRNILETEEGRKKEITDIKRKLNQLENDLDQQKKYNRELERQVVRLEKEKHDLLSRRYRQNKQAEPVPDKIYDIKNTMRQFTAMNLKNKHEESAYTLEKKIKRSEIYKTQLSEINRKQNLQTTRTIIKQRVSRPLQTSALEKRIQSLNKEIKKSRQKLSKTKEQRYAF